MHLCETMNVNRAIHGLSLAAAGLCLLACNAQGKGSPSGSPEMQAGGTSVQKSADAAIVSRLAAARCDQEDACKNIGPGGKYDSRSVCLDVIRGSIGNDLNAYACPRGLDRDAIERCVAAIRSEACSTPFDTLARFEKCRTSAICMN
jgi:hypothetical protein